MTTTSTPSALCKANPLIGNATLITMAFRGEDLSPIAASLIARAQADDDDANALMDLSTILFLRRNDQLALATQRHALAVSRRYSLKEPERPSTRLLALMSAGDLMANTPLAFLVQDSDISTSMLYLKAGEALPCKLPEHDVLLVAISESDETRALLTGLVEPLSRHPQPVLNRPDRIARTARELAFLSLESLPGVVMPRSVRVSRSDALSLAADASLLPGLLPAGTYPLIVRPVGSHAGRCLAKLESAEDLANYMGQAEQDEFILSPFVDYRSPDGLFRKFRVVIIDGVPYPGHMGISAHWMIHYLNAGMTESATKRQEEEHFMKTFDAVFARRHRDALGAIADALNLEYVVIDCAEAPTGELLVFEVDPAAVVHAMDPTELFPYKRRHMKEVFDAFSALLASFKRGQLAGI
jgi:glutathione synthase/RimK-type ligase-like ATP-grasp enzyme